MMQKVLQKQKVLHDSRRYYRNDEEQIINASKILFRFSEIISPTSAVREADVEWIMTQTKVKKSMLLLD